MPNYAQPFGRVGGAVGGAAGGATGGLLGHLSSLLEPLDYPRQALWNLGRSGYHALTGEGSLDDVVSALPGAIGALGTGALAATGAGLPAAIGLGSLLGGVSQGVGKLKGDDRFNAANSDDLVQQLGMDPETFGGKAAGFGLGALLDPMTYAGGIGLGEKGAAKGAELAGNYGKKLENIANWAGPGYSTGYEDLRRMVLDSPKYAGLKPNKQEWVMNNLEQLGKTPGLSDILSELHPDSKLLGVGGETLSFETPHGGVTNLSRNSENFQDIGRRMNPFAPPPPRAASEDVAQAFRSKPISGPDTTFQGPGLAARVEHMPMYKMTGLSHEQIYQLPEAQALAERLSRQGEDLWDLHAGNVAYDPSGKLQVLDAGALNPRPGYPGLPRPETLQPAEGNFVDNALLKLLGGQQSVRNELEAGIRPGAPLIRPPMAGPQTPDWQRLLQETSPQINPGPTDILDLGRPASGARVSRVPSSQVVDLAGPPESPLGQALGAASPAAQMEDRLNRMMRNLRPGR